MLHFRQSQNTRLSTMAEKQAPDKDKVEKQFNLVITKIREYVEMTSDQVLKTEGKSYYKAITLN